MMRYATALLDRQFRSADVHSAIELHRVGVHDFPAEPLGDVKSQLRLPGSRRADDRQWPHSCQTPAK